MREIDYNDPRGFEVANGFKKSDVKLPVRSTIASAGYDFFSLDDATINTGESKTIRTGVKAYMLPNEVLLLLPRSSMGIKKNLTLANTVGVIDADYYGNKSNDGHILICLFNNGIKPQTIHTGDKIAQGIFVKFLSGNDIPTGKRIGGIGSTRK